MSSLKRLTTALGALAMCAALAGPAAAQVSDVINATATVNNGYAVLTITGVSDLQFGTLDAQACLAGTPCANVNDGRFDVTGEAGVGVLAQFTLPASLSGPGGDVLLVDFDDATFGKVLNHGLGTVFSTFNPTVNNTLSIDGSGFLDIAIAALATTRSDQTDGLYTGTITLTVSY